mmetsp:Transcript_7142/g.20937  ORF Transcript_7142/g.20937 Transcript_7142/m.20937 type:complete len:257 (-) Transcript_7142:893-1663(-)
MGVAPQMGPRSPAPLAVRPAHPPCRVALHRAGQIPHPSPVRVVAEQGEGAGEVVAGGPQAAHALGLGHEVPHVPVRRHAAAETALTRPRIHPHHVHVRTVAEGNVKGGRCLGAGAVEGVGHGVGGAGGNVAQPQAPRRRRLVTPRRPEGEHGIEDLLKEAVTAHRHNTIKAAQLLPRVLLQEAAAVVLPRCGHHRVRYASEVHDGSSNILPHVGGTPCATMRILEHQKRPRSIHCLINCSANGGGPFCSPLRTRCL